MVHIKFTCRLDTLGNIDRKSHLKRYLYSICYIAFDHAETKLYTKVLFGQIFRGGVL